MLYRSWNEKLDNHKIIRLGKDKIITINRRGNAQRKLQWLTIYYLSKLPSDV